MTVIGITGHRILAEQDKITSGLNAALEHIACAYSDQPLQLLSPLAEGADCLAAQQALLQPCYSLVVPLPLPIDAYRQDFTTPETQAIFDALLFQADQVIILPLVPARTQAYQAVGEYILQNSDVLLAVWDG